MWEYYIQTLNELRYGTISTVSSMCVGLCKETVCSGEVSATVEVCCVQVKVSREQYHQKGF